jgi:hypothetical protein
MGLALDEPKGDDARIEAEGFPFVMASEVVDAIRSYGSLFIDYTDHPWIKGFQLSFLGKVPC